MLLNHFILPNIIIFLVFFLHGTAIHFLVSKVLLGTKYNTLINFISVALYGLLAVVSFGFLKTYPVLFYTVLFVFFNIDFLIRYIRINVWSVLMCSLAIVLHIVSIHTIAFSVFSLQTGSSYYDLIQSAYLPKIIAVTMVVLSLCTYIVIKLIPAKYYLLISSNHEQLGFLNILFGLFVLYMGINTMFFSAPKMNMMLAINEIAISLVMLCGMYLGLFFLIRINLLQGYKEKSELLEETIDRDKLYKELMLSDTLVTYELNCNNDILYKLTEGGKDLLLGEVQSYSDMMKNIINNKICFEDRKILEENLMPAPLIDKYKHGQSDITLEYRRIRQDNTYGWVRTTINTAGDEKTGDITAVIVVKDIEIEKQNHLKLQYKAERDSLTGAYNKATLQKMIVEYLKTDEKGTLLILDVDDFKSVNDKMGHMYGDAVLCEFVNIVKNTFRTEDIVGRIGGDEFIIYMRYITSEISISNKAEMLCRNIANTMKWDKKHECKVSCSVGISIAPYHGTQFEELYHHADIALYAAKKKGKNTHTIYKGTEEADLYSQRTAIDSEEPKTSS